MNIPLLTLKQLQPEPSTDYPTTAVPDVATTTIHTAFQSVSKPVAPLLKPKSRKLNWRRIADCSLEEVVHTAQTAGYDGMRQYAAMLIHGIAAAADISRTPSTTVAHAFRIAQLCLACANARTEGSASDDQQREQLEADLQGARAAHDTLAAQLAASEHRNASQTKAMRGIVTQLHALQRQPGAQAFIRAAETLQDMVQQMHEERLAVPAPRARSPPASPGLTGMSPGRWTAMMAKAGPMHALNELVNETHTAVQEIAGAVRSMPDRAARQAAEVDSMSARVRQLEQDLQGAQAQADAQKEYAQSCKAELLRARQALVQSQEDTQAALARLQAAHAAQLQRMQDALSATRARATDAEHSRIQQAQQLALLSAKQPSPAHEQAEAAIVRHLQHSLSTSQSQVAQAGQARDQALAQAAEQRQAMHRLAVTGRAWVLVSALQSARRRALQSAMGAWRRGVRAVVSRELADTRDALQHQVQAAARAEAACSALRSSMRQQHLAHARSLEQAMLTRWTQPVSRVPAVLRDAPALAVVGSLQAGSMPVWQREAMSEVNVQAAMARRAAASPAELADPAMQAATAAVDRAMHWVLASAAAGSRSGDALEPDRLSITKRWLQLPMAVLPGIRADRDARESTQALALRAASRAVAHFPHSYSDVRRMGTRILSEVSALSGKTAVDMSSQPGAAVLAEAIAASVGNIATIVRQHAGSAMTMTRAAAPQSEAAADAMADIRAWVQAAQVEPGYEQSRSAAAALQQALSAHGAHSACGSPTRTPARPDDEPPVPASPYVPWALGHSASRGSWTPGASSQPRALASCASAERLHGSVPATPASTSQRTSFISPAHSAVQVSRPSTQVQHVVLSDDSEEEVSSPVRGRAHSPGHRLWQPQLDEARSPVTGSPAAARPGSSQGNDALAMTASPARPAGSPVPGIGWPLHVSSSSSESSLSVHSIQ